MKAVEFDRSRASFDRYDRFWIEDRDHFLRFESGEVCYTHSSPVPEHRKHFPALGVTIFMAGDSHAPKLYDPGTGKEINVAQLTHKNGAPYMVWDHERNVIKTLDRQHKNMRVPRPLRFATAYWASDDSEPVAGEVEYYPPVALPKESRAFVLECSKAAKFVQTMRTDNPTMLSLARRGDAVTVEEINKAVSGGVEPVTFLEQFNDRVLRRIINSPTSLVGRSKVCIPHAVVKAA